MLLAQIDGITLIAKPVFQAIGLRWEGTFAEADAKVFGRCITH